MFNAFATIDANSPSLARQASIALTPRASQLPPLLFPCRSVCSVDKSPDNPFSLSRVSRVSRAKWLPAAAVVAAAAIFAALATTSAAVLHADGAVALGIHGVI